MMRTRANTIQNIIATCNHPYKTLVKVIDCPPLPTKRRRSRTTARAEIKLAEGSCSFWCTIHEWLSMLWSVRWISCRRRPALSWQYYWSQQYFSFSCLNLQPQASCWGNLWREEIFAVHTVQPTYKLCITNWQHIYIYTCICCSYIVDAHGARRYGGAVSFPVS